MSAPVVTALGAGIAGAFTSGLGFLAQAADGSADIAPYLSGAGSAVAVTTLGYVVKKFLSGDLVARQVAESEREKSLMLASTAEREDRLMRVIGELTALVERESKRAEDTNRLLWRVDQLLGGPEQRKPRRST